jgi:hypothetical protein
MSDDLLKEFEMVALECIAEPGVDFRNSSWETLALAVDWENPIPDANSNNLNDRTGSGVWQSKCLFIPGMSAQVDVFHSDGPLTERICDGSDLVARQLCNGYPKVRTLTCPPQRTMAALAFCCEDWTPTSAEQGDGDQSSSSLRLRR